MRFLPVLVGSLFFILLAAAPAASEPAWQDTHYLAVSPVPFACAPDDHPILPTEGPDPDDPAWLTSGEPECAVADAENALREARGDERVWHGYGVARHHYGPEHDGSMALADTSDPAFGTGMSFLYVVAEDWSNGEQHASAGCGPQSITLPASPRPHADMEPTNWWAYIEAVGVDVDLTVCFATTGVLHATWGH